MKLFILCTLIAVSFALYDDGEDSQGSAKKCVKDYTPCAVAAEGRFRDTEKCLWTFKKCMEGNCRPDCQTTYKKCMHKTGNLSADLQKCRLDHSTCYAGCKEKIFKLED